MSMPLRRAISRQIIQLRSKPTQLGTKTFWAAYQPGGGASRPIWAGPPFFSPHLPLIIFTALPSLLMADGLRGRAKA